ncbi:endonuclease domain-containing protein [Sphingomonas sp.]|uniref:endonuclease domain-containing protein n=1 Tax=Sphingomonas sp. TaxID=28214 RepID=UPI002EDAA12F
MARRIDPELTRRARELRNNPTLTELAVWHRISRYRPAFTRQLIVPPFIIDLACRTARLGIEFDGSQHLETAEADERRTRYLERRAGGSSACGTQRFSPIPMAPRSIFWRRPPSASAGSTPCPSLSGGETATTPDALSGS